MNHSSIYRIVFAVSLRLGELSACAVILVPEYNATLREETLQIAKKVDLFWGRLLDTELSARHYAAFKDQYIEIETDIRGLSKK